MPNISVVIPAYNSMRYLPETLESILQQTFTDFEVLIINDGSSDQIVKWASGILDPRVKLISQANQGVSVARNTGIAQAQGEYIAFLDADDLWEITKLEKQVHCLENNPTVGLVHTWMALIDEQSKRTGRIMKFNTEGKVWQQLVQRNTIACSSVMVRRCCFETVGVFALDRNMHPVEDWDMWLRIASRYPFSLIKEPLLLYRQHANNSSKQWQAMDKAFHLTIEKTFESAPRELQYLKHHSYGHANLCVAWKALQSSDRDYQRIVDFRRAALAHYPQLRYSNEYIRLSLALILMRLFGLNGYDRALKLIYSVRRRISNFAR